MNQNNQKKKVLIVTDNVVSMTGFARAARLYIKYLYETGKYEIIHACIGSTDSPDMARFPWPSVGLVDMGQINQIKQQNKPETHGDIDRQAGYGYFKLDEIVKKYKPNYIFLAQDVWAFSGHVDKPWFKALNPVLWVTLDSLPILPNALEISPKVKNYWIWADFATKEMHRLGQTHVKTVRGPVDIKNFHRLSDPIRADLRLRNGINEKDFVSIFVGRNQLRKSYPQMLGGFKLFKDKYPNSKFIVVCNWGEGWDLQRLIKEYNIDNNDILTPYVCKSCQNYEVKPFTGHDLDCKHCKAQKSQVTTSPGLGVSDTDLNKIYNLADISLSVFTSGGQELHTQQSMLIQLPTLVTNYSCGEDACTPEAGGIPLEWYEYREPGGTQFIKATCTPEVIFSKMNQVYKMTELQRREIGAKSRKWVLNNFSVEKIGKQMEDFIDNTPIPDYNFDDKEEAKDPYFQVPDIKDDDEWIVCLYKNILRMPITPEHQDHKHWKDKLVQGMPRKDIENYFKKVAWDENQKKNLQNVKFEDLLNKEDKKRVIFIMKESAGDIFMSTSLFKSIRERYPKPDWGFYVSTKAEYKEIIDGNPYVDKWLEFNNQFENLIWMEGNSQHNGYFDVCYLPTLSTQTALSYLHNSEDIAHLETKY